MIPGSTGPGPVPSIWSRWRDSFGEAHLTLDAVVAHVDGELAPGPAGRATEHVQRCLLCAAEVAAQRRTRGMLRGADAPGAPSGLLSALRAIPDEPSTPPSPAGLAPGDDPHDGRRDGDQDGTGDDHADGSRAGRGAPGRRRRGERGGLRRGLPVAVASGIALGSVALAAVPALPMTSPVARSVAPGSPAGRGIAGADAFAVLSHRPGATAPPTTVAPTPATVAPTAAVPTTAAPTTSVPMTSARPAPAPGAPSPTGP